MDFFLFLLVNCTLFVRPSEIIPGFEEVPIYNILIVLAFLAASPKIIQHLHPNQLSGEPITFCVLGMLPAIMMSHLSRFDIYNARYNSLDFSKILVYYLLLIAVVNSLWRFRVFLYLVTLFATTNSVVAMLHYFDIINVPSLKVLEYFERLDPETGLPIVIRRLEATGIFSDPNDLSMIAVFGIVVSLYGTVDTQLGGGRVLWAIPLGILLLTIFLTKSRGGILALGVAVAVLSYLRFGIWKTIAALVMFVPFAGLVLIDRGSAMDEGTGASRIELWSESLALIKQYPLFGVGSHELESQIGMAAHNTFIHCFSELGMFGGALFFGAFWFSLVSLWEIGRRMSSSNGCGVDPMVRRLYPLVVATTFCCTTSLLSISRAYVVPTYLILGIVNVYSLEMKRRGVSLNHLTLSRIAALVPLSVAFIVVVYLFINMSIR